MKYLFTFFIFYFLIINSVFCQTNNTNFEIVYNASYKPILDLSNYKEFNFTVTTDGLNSLGQWSNRMKLDSISKFGEIQNEDVSKFKDYDNYSIETSANSLRYYETIGGETYTYKEEIPTNWTFIEENKVIKGYDCQKATIIYGGRNWTVWFTKEIPLNAGPYKFKGLPGLIVKAHDENYDYNFDLISVKRKGEIQLKRTHFSISEGSPISIDRIKLLRFKHRYKSMTFNERIKYINRDKEGQVEIELFSEDGDSKEFRNYSNKGKINLIELDYL